MSTKLVCDPCWEKRRPETPKPHRMPEDVREVEDCGYCGRPSKSGILLNATDWPT